MSHLTILFPLNILITFPELEFHASNMGWLKISVPIGHLLQHYIFKSISCSGQWTLQRILNILKASFVLFLSLCCICLQCYIVLFSFVPPYTFLGKNVTQTMFLNFYLKLLHHVEEYLSIYRDLKEVKNPHSSIN